MAKACSRPGVRTGCPLVLLAVLALIPAVANALPVYEAGDSIAKFETQGSWESGAEGLVASGESDPNPGYILVPRPAFANGVFRASVGADRKLEISLLFRASSRDQKLQDAIAIHFRKKRVRLESVTADATLPITPWETMKGLGRTESIEVVAVFMGSAILVQLYTSEGKFLDALVAHTGTANAGDVGARRVPDKMPRGQIKSLATFDLCSDWVGPGADAPRMAWIAPSDLENAKIAAKDELEILESTESHIVVRTGLARLTKMGCLGIRPSRVAVDSPQKFLDPDYLAHSATVEKTERGFDIDTGFKDPERVNAILHAYAKRFPRRAKLVEIGRSRQERPIYAMAITSDLAYARERPTLLLNGAHHGNEPLSVEFVLDAIQRLLEHPEEPAYAELLERFVVWCVPLVNPDGLHTHMHVTRRAGRKNGLRHDVGKDDAMAERHHGVDLNRNYPFRWADLGKKGSSPRLSHMWYRGEEPASEPETRAMMALAESERFMASISYHTGNVIILAPYTIDETVNPEPNDAWEVGEFISSQMPVHPPTKRTYDLAAQIYSVDGTDQDWHRHQHGTVALLVEGSNQSYTNPDARRSVVEAVRRSWELLGERSLERAVHGRVVDSAGNPVAATISIDEIKLGAGERWTTRCRDGRFDRYLPGPGTWHVRAVLADGRSVVQAVEIGEADDAIRVELRVEGDALERPACELVVDWPKLETPVVFAKAGARVVDRVRELGAAVTRVAKPTDPAPTPIVHTEPRLPTPEDGSSQGGGCCRTNRDGGDSSSWIWGLVTLGLLTRRMRV